MSGTEWAVALAGVGAIAWVNWYFFFAERTSTTARVAGDTQTVDVLVRGGYDPGVIHAKRGTPLRLVFDRQETSSCSEEVVLSAFGIRRFLPPFEKTAVELTPNETGTFDITCGMSMLHATLVVES
jgi:plastocyanin domain-containing protein